MTNGQTERWTKSFHKLELFCIPANKIQNGLDLDLDPLTYYVIWIICRFMCMSVPTLVCWAKHYPFIGCILRAKDQPTDILLYWCVKRNTYFPQNTHFREDKAYTVSPCMNNSGRSLNIWSLIQGSKVLSVPETDLYMYSTVNELLTYIFLLALAVLLHDL